MTLVAPKASCIGLISHLREYALALGENEVDLIWDWLRSAELRYDFAIPAEVLDIDTALAQTQAALDKLSEAQLEQFYNDLTELERDKLQLPPPDFTEGEADDSLSRP